MTLDLVMPNMTGQEVIQHLRAAGRNVRIIVVSALNQRQCLLEAICQGADDYVVKPFDPAKIEAAITTVWAWSLPE